MGKALPDLEGVPVSKDAVVELTDGERAVLNIVFNGDHTWRQNTAVFTARGRQRLASKVEELEAKARYPGTKHFKMEAAYRAEMVQRVITKIDAALSPLAH